MKTKKNQKRKLRVKEKEREMVKKSTKGAKCGGHKTSTSQGISSTSSTKGLQPQSPKAESSSHGPQRQSTQTSPFGLQVPDDYEAEIFKNGVPTVVLYHKSIQVCYPSSCRKQCNPQYMKAPHNMLFQMKTFRK